MSRMSTFQKTLVLQSGSGWRRHIPRSGSAPSAPRALAWSIALAFAFASASGTATGQPVGGVAIHGTMNLSTSGSKTVISTTNGANSRHSAINWQSFSVPTDTSTQFMQPDAQSTVVNRVFGSTPTAIFGTLGSNGRVILVNPAGIVVGAGAVVDTAAFTASTLSVSDANARAGWLKFGEPQRPGGGLIQVDGHIVARSGDITLLAPQLSVGAPALMQAPDGSIILAAGQQAEIAARGLDGIRLIVQAPTDQAVNLGSLKADAVGMFASSLRHSGQIDVQAVTAEGGKVVLQAAARSEVNGTVNANALAGRGGQIQITADDVRLESGTRLNTSGETGGGKVLIGGGWQGSDSSVRNASRTSVASDVDIRSDATIQGNGGTVVVWSDASTAFAGRASARGGVNGGNGGQVEVSGKHQLSFTGHVDTLAPAGAKGSLLLDPEYIFIIEGGKDPVSSGAEFGDGAVNQVSISPASVSESATNVILQANRDITFVDSILMVTPGVGLTAQAGGGIQIQPGGAIRTKGGAVTLVAGDPAAHTKDPGGAIKLLGGIDTTAAGQFPAGADVKLSSLATGERTGAIMLDNSVTAGTGGRLLLSAKQGFINQTAGVLTGRELQASATSGLSLPQANQVDTVSLDGGASWVDFKNTRAQTLVSSANGSDIRLASIGDLLVDGEINARNSVYISASKNEDNPTLASVGTAENQGSVITAPSSPVSTEVGASVRSSSSGLIKTSATDAGTIAIEAGSIGEAARPVRLDVSGDVHLTTTDTNSGKGSIFVQQVNGRMDLGNYHVQASGSGVNLEFTGPASGDGTTVKADLRNFYTPSNDSNVRIVAPKGDVQLANLSEGGEWQVAVNKMDVLAQGDGASVLVGSSESNTPLRVWASSGLNIKSTGQNGSIQLNRDLKNLSSGPAAYLALAAQGDIAGGRALSTEAGDVTASSGGAMILANVLAGNALSTQRDAPALKLQSVSGPIRTGSLSTLGGDVSVISGADIQTGDIRTGASSPAGSGLPANGNVYSAGVSESQPRETTAIDSSTFQRAGNVILTAGGIGSIRSGSIETLGGSGNARFLNGGDITVKSANGAIATARINSSAGTASSNGLGGAGKAGSVLIERARGDLVLEAMTIAANGGNGYQGANDDGSGADAGKVTLRANQGALAFQGSISSRGGDGALGDELRHQGGGAGTPIELSASAGIVFTAGLTRFDNADGARPGAVESGQPAVRASGLINMNSGGAGISQREGSQLDTLGNTIGFKSQGPVLLASNDNRLAQAFGTAAGQVRVTGLNGVSHSGIAVSGEGQSIELVNHAADGSVDIQGPLSAAGDIRLNASDLTVRDTVISHSGDIFLAATQSIWVTRSSNGMGGPGELSARHILVDAPKTFLMQGNVFPGGAGGIGTMKITGAGNMTVDAGAQLHVDFTPEGQSDQILAAGVVKFLPPVPSGSLPPATVVTGAQAGQPPAGSYPIVQGGSGALPALLGTVNDATLKFGASGLLLDKGPAATASGPYDMTPVLLSLNGVDSSSLLSLPLGREYDDRLRGALTFFADETPICPR